MLKARGSVTVTVAVLWTAYGDDEINDKSTYLPLFFFRSTPLSRYLLGFLPPSCSGRESLQITATGQTNIVKTLN